MYLKTLLFAAFLMLPLVLISKRWLKGKKAKYALIGNLVSFATCCALVIITSAGSAEAAGVGAAAGSSAVGMGFLAAALATGAACIGAGIAISAAASAALGAISEDSSLLGKSLIFVALAEGVALYGLLISIQILNKLPSLA